MKTWCILVGWVLQSDIYHSIYPFILGSQMYNNIFFNMWLSIYTINSQCKYDKVCYLLSKFWNDIFELITYKLSSMLMKVYYDDAHTIFFLKIRIIKHSVSKFIIMVSVYLNLIDKIFMKWHMKIYPFLFLTCL